MAQIPGSLVPGRQQQDIPPPPPKSAPGTIVPLPEKSVAPAQAETIRFTLASIRLEGNKALSTADLQPTWMGYLNKTISVATLYEITNAITQRYADAGYALSFALLPEQVISNGNITIRIVEGFVDSVTFSQKDFPAGTAVPNRIQDMADKIKASRPLKSADLERYLLLINDLPGIAAYGTFSASKTTEDASTLHIELNHQRFSAHASVDNFLPSSLGYWNGSVGASVYATPENLGSLDLTARCGVFCNIYNAQSLAWSRYIGSEGAKIGVRANYSNETPDKGVLSALDFQGNQSSYMLEGTYPLIRSRQENLNLGTSFNWTNSETEIFAGTLTRDHIRTVNAYGSYDYADRTGAVSLARVDVTQGLSVLNATKDSDPLRSRSLGSSDFTNIGLYLARNQPMGSLIKGMDSFSIYTAASGQLAATDPLLSVSQCFYGGRDIGRGYNSGNLSGDHCLMGTVELRHDFMASGLNFQAYGFGDAGAVWRRGNTALTGEADSSGGQSAGGGLRMMINQNVQTGLELAVPLRKSVTEDGHNDPRVFFSINLRH